jgi:NAD+ diphosphatase
MDPAWVAEQLRSPTARFVAAGAGGVLVDDRQPPALRRSPLAVLGEHADVLTGEPILLGLERHVPLFALDLDRLQSTTSPSWAENPKLVELRDAGALLPHAEAGLAAYLSSLLGWHRTHRFCANCGAATELRGAGSMRKCPSCGAQHFPRVDPVVIMLVENAGRLLLGRHAAWPPQRYSVLAGFVAPGESLEEAIKREVREESGIRIDRSTFVASQPWPFPSSLMLGFEAHALDGDPAPLDGELEDVRWFAGDVVSAAVAGASGELKLPPTISIARFLIDRWHASRR